MVHAVGHRCNWGFIRHSVIMKPAVLLATFVPLSSLAAAHAESAEDWITTL